MITQEIQYVREMNRNYLVLHGEENQVEIDYQTRMVLENNISVFADMQVRQIDCHLEYYYEISGKITLEQWMQKQLIGRQELQALFIALCRAVQAVNEYLLDADRVFLNPTCILLDSVSLQVQFCYGAAAGTPFLEALQELMQHLLTRLNHNDEETVRIGYTLYQYCQQKYYAIEEMLSVFETERRRDGESYESRPDLSTNEKPYGAGGMDNLEETAILSYEENPNGFFYGEKEEMALQMENRNAADRYTGWQWLLESILTGLLAVSAGVYYYIRKEVLILFLFVLLIVLCLWGGYRFLREKG